MKPMLVKPLPGTRPGGRNNANLTSLRPSPLWDWGQCPHFADEESQAQDRWTGLRADWLAGGKARIRTQVCWLSVLTLSTHVLGQLSTPGPSLPKRRPLRCFVSLKANQKNSLQLPAGISSIGLWAFLVRMHPGPYRPWWNRYFSNQRVKPELGFLENHSSGMLASDQTVPQFRILKLSRTYGEPFRV